MSIQPHQASGASRADVKHPPRSTHFADFHHTTGPPLPPPEADNVPTNHPGHAALGAHDAYPMLPSNFPGFDPYRLYMLPPFPSKPSSPTVGQLCECPPLPAHHHQVTVMKSLSPAFSMPSKKPKAGPGQQSVISTCSKPWSKRTISFISTNLWARMVTIYRTSSKLHGVKVISLQHTLRRV
jgi:hypothetical protein